MEDLRRQVVKPTKSPAAIIAKRKANLFRTHAPLWCSDLLSFVFGKLLASLLLQRRTDRSNLGADLKRRARQRLGRFRLQDLSGVRGPPMLVFGQPREEGPPPMLVFAQPPGPPPMLVFAQPPGPPPMLVFAQPA